MAMGIVCGVEEAGRGPVIGPMVMTACWSDDEEAVRKAGAKDSKQLTPAQREAVFERLLTLKKRKKIDFEVAVLSPREIDDAVQGAQDNLNRLELRTSARLINVALKRAGLATVIIDCPTVSTAKYATAVRKLLDREVEVIAENKADENYVIVGAASILAKVTRDREIEAIKKKIKVNFGSGYPADPLTQKFLRENYAKKEYASHFRKSWASYRELAERSKQRLLVGYGSEEGEAKPTPVHAAELKRFETLLEHGFELRPPTNRYEVVRLASKDATIIKYSTGKLVVQGKGKAAAERLLQRLNIRH
jgi:ribonuclease HII